MFSLCKSCGKLLTHFKKIFYSNKNVDTKHWTKLKIYNISPPIYIGSLKYEILYGEARNVSDYTYALHYYPMILCYRYLD